MRALVHEGMHYIHGGDGREELYDLRADPLRDLAETPAGAAVVERLRRRIEELL